MKLIEPRNLKGFRDYLPKEQIARSKMFEKIRKAFELFGFEPLETPVLEYEDILAGKYGAEGEKLMYRFKDQGERDVAMRYDLTIPLARVVAQYGINEVPRPFKRYQIAPVWRADKPQKGRYREFYQCDADIVGADLGIADAECIFLLETILRELGLKKFKIKINNRKILNAIMTTAGLKAEQVLDGIRIIDKLEKVGAKAVVEELESKLGMTKNEAEGLIRLASTKVPDVGVLKTFMSKYILRDPQGQAGFEELNKVFTALKEFGAKNVEIDLNLARGLDYYNSIVYEAVIEESTEARRFGSVGGGGRYDKLLGLFSGKDIPAVGVSIGIDRLFAAMQELGLIEQSGVVDVLVLNFGVAFEADNMKMLNELRSAGIASELYYTEADKADAKPDMKKQFAYAEAKATPFALLYGEEEQKNSTVTIRDLKTRKQQSVKRDELVKELKNLLNK